MRVFLHEAWLLEKRSVEIRVCTYHQHHSRWHMAPPFSCSESCVDLLAWLIPIQKLGMASISPCRASTKKTHIITYYSKYRYLLGFIMKVNVRKSVRNGNRDSKFFLRWNFVIIMTLLLHTARTNILSLKKNTYKSYFEVHFKIRSILSMKIGVNSDPDKYMCPCSMT